jgi:hypothetical protein
MGAAILRYETYGTRLPTLEDVGTKSVWSDNFHDRLSLFTLCIRRKTIVFVTSADDVSLKLVLLFCDKKIVVELSFNGIGEVSSRPLSRNSIFFTTQAASYEVSRKFLAQISKDRTKPSVIHLAAVRDLNSVRCWYSALQFKTDEVLKVIAFKEQKDLTRQTHL